MGERLTIPFDPPRDPKAPVPLDYGHVDPAGDVINRSAASSHALFDKLGGWRQVTFAVGLALTFGGYGAGMSHGHDETVFAMTLGGLLIGLAVPIPRRRRDG